MKSLIFCAILLLSSSFQIIASSDEFENSSDDEYSTESTLSDDSDDEIYSCPCCQAVRDGIKSLPAEHDAPSRSYLSPQEILLFVSTGSTSKPTYAQLMNTLRSPSYASAKSGWDVLIGQRILKNYTSEIKTGEDIDVLYHIALKAQDAIFDHGLIFYLTKTIFVDWQLFPNFYGKIRPDVLERVVQIVANREIETEEKSSLLMLLYRNGTVRFSTPNLIQTVEEFVVQENGKIRFDALLSFLENHQIELNENMIKKILVVILGQSQSWYQKILLATALLDDPVYADHFLQNAARKIILSRVVHIEDGSYKIRQSPEMVQTLLSAPDIEGKSLPDIVLKKDQDINLVYGNWMSSNVTLRRVNIDYILCSPSFSEKALADHGRFLCCFLLTEGRLNSTDLTYLNLWDVLENPNNSRAQKYAATPGRWKSILWDAYFDIPSMKDGQYLPDFSYSKDHHHQIKANAWLESRVVVQRKNYEKLLSCAFKKVHSEFLSQFFENTTRFEGTDLTYHDLERILRKDIPGNWKKSVMRAILPQVIFAGDTLPPQRVNMLVDYLRDNPLTTEIKTILEKELQDDNLSPSDKHKIVTTLPSELQQKYASLMIHEEIEHIEESKEEEEKSTDIKPKHSPTRKKGQKPKVMPVEIKPTKREIEAKLRAQKEAEIAQMHLDAETAFTEKRYDEARAIYINIQRLFLEDYDAQLEQNPVKYMEILNLNQKIRRIEKAKTL